MRIRQVRNATIIIEYAGKKFLVDPVLADQGTSPPFPQSIRQELLNPLVSLPMPIEEILNVDAVIVTHLHADHFDDAAKDLLSKEMHMFVQNERDAKKFGEYGFRHVEVLKEDTTFAGITLIKTPGQHGRATEEELVRFGKVCGVVFKHPGEKTLYVAGDTVWYEAIHEVIKTHQPEVIVVNGGDNQAFGISLVMGKADIYAVQQAAPAAKIIVSHMEAMNHWTLSRRELRNFIQAKGITSKVLVPDDGESYPF